MEQIYFNYYTNGLMLLPSDKVLCPRCKGLGHHDDYDWGEYSIDDQDYIQCYLCKGLGNIDWVTRIVRSGWERKELDFIAVQYVGRKDSKSYIY